MKEIKIDSIEDLLAMVNSLPSHYVFRGQSNADWQLESGIERVVGSKIGAIEIKRAEDYLISGFKSKYEIYGGSENKPSSKLSWLAVMQHYGVPTRLIDFTESPYVALYFALENYIPSLRKDFSMFSIDYRAVMACSIVEVKKKIPKFSEHDIGVNGNNDKVFEEIIDNADMDIAWITEPKELNARMDRQSGTFLISGDVNKKIVDVLGGNIYSKCDITKYRIDQSLYKSVFALLRKVGISSKSIYGDLGGLARSLRMELQVYHC